MKKTLFALAIGALSISSVANANWYAEANLGYSKVKSSNWDYGDINDNKFSPSVAVGYRLGDLRFALDYTHYGKINYGYTVNEGNTNVIGNGNVKVQSLGLSALYDIELGSDFKPFVGVRLANNHIKLQETFMETAPGYLSRESVSESDTTFGYGAVVGVSYNINQNVSALVALDYNYLGKVEDVKFKQYGAKVGIRYEF